MIIAVQLQITIVSINTPNACINPAFTGVSHSAAAAAHGADPEPASLENNPLFTPFIRTAPNPPAAECDTPVKAGFIQALGVFIDTIVICSCTAMIMLLVPEKMIAGLEGMELLQTAMNYHLGKFGVIFIAVTLFLFSFSTFLGILFYARGNVAYLLGDKWCWQTAYKILALVMLFIGGIAAYHIVWDLGDVGIGLMTIFNIVTLYPMGGEALEELRKYEKNKQ